MALVGAGDGDAILDLVLLYTSTFSDAPVDF
eukprot:SAG25_NODE_12593_length_277_cov_2.039326_1_plen_30_part_01